MLARREPLKARGSRPRTGRVVALALVGLASLAGCGRGDPSPDVDVAYGDGVGIRIDGAHLAPYEVVIAADRAADLRPLVQPLSALVHAALLACPGAVAASEEARATTLAFSVDEKQLRRARSGAPRGESAPGESCLIGQLEGRSLSVPSPPQHLLLQIRTAPPPAAGGAATPREPNAPG